MRPHLYLYWMTFAIVAVALALAATGCKQQPAYAEQYACIHKGGGTSC